MANFKPDPTGGAGGITPGQNITDADLTLFAMLGLTETEGAAQVTVGSTPTGVPYSPQFIAAHPTTPDITTAKPLAKAVQDFYRRTPEQRAAIQRGLLSGGFYSSTNNLIEGEPDPDSVRAYAEAAKRAVIQGKSIEDVMSDAQGSVSDDQVNKLLGPGGAAARGGGKAGGDARVGPQGAQVTPTHPDDIRAVAMKTSRELLGQGFNDAQLSQFVSAYQSMEATQGGMAPSVQSAVTRQAQTAAPAQFEATNIANAYDLLMKSIQSLGGGGPGTTTGGGLSGS